MRTRLCEKRGLNSTVGADPPLYIVASLGSSATDKADTGYDYYVKIEEHGIEPYGDQRRVIYDWTGFPSRVFDVSFTEDCNTAVLFL